MKKLLVSLMAFSMVLVGCTKNDDSTDNSGNTETSAEIIMITDKGTIDDKSFNQGTWEGVKAYGEKNNIKTAYIQPLDATDAEYLNAIDQAVERGAKVVVTPGYLFEPAIYEAQTKYPEVKFVLIDGNPHTADYSTYLTADNTIGITYREQESGYLAGYAAVKEGATSLGFMGGMAVPAVVSFGYGFVQGANDAAEELGVTVTMKYHYTGDFKATPEVQSLAASWYKDGVQMIFACGGAVGNSVMAAAEAYDGEKVWVIGVDVDQSNESDTVITSAYKQLAVSVQNTLAAIYDESFDDVDNDKVLYRGGANVVLGATEDATGLPMGTSRFTNFSNDDYKAVYKKIVDGEITILGNADINDEVGSPMKLTTTKVTIEEIK